MEIVTTEDIKVPAEFITRKILAQLELGKKVLWFATGGSAIAVQVLAAEIISKQPHEGLTITLTDERYGPIGHKDSNWQQSLEKGFNLPDAKLMPILTGDSLEETTEKFNQLLKEEFPKAQYKIGLFGVGTNSHTAGIMPGSGAVDSDDFAYGYKSDPYERITITTKTILMLDEAVVWMHGKEKWPVIENLSREIPINEAPVQILKQVPQLTIFTNYKKI